LALFFFSFLVPFFAFAFAFASALGGAIIRPLLFSLDKIVLEKFNFLFQYERFLFSFTLLILHTPNFVLTLIVLFGVAQIIPILPCIISNSE
jgi:hypothetical protein